MRRPLILLAAAKVVPSSPAFFLVLLLTACAPEPHDAPGNLTLLQNTTLPDSTRIAADVRLLSLSPKTDPSRLHALETILTEPAATDDLRTYALDQLAAADPAFAAAAISRALPRFSSDLLPHACLVAANLHDPHLIPPLLRSLARNPSLRTNRPEVPAIEQLANKKIAQLLPEIIVASTDPATRYASLELVEAFTQPAEIRAALSSVKPSPEDRLLLAVQFSLRRLDYIPAGRNEVEWTLWLIDHPQLPIVTDAATLKNSPTGLYAPRFIGTLAFNNQDSAGTTLRSHSRDVLLEIIEHLMPAHHVSRAEESAPDESLAANLPKLSRGDLLNITILLTTLQRPAFCKEILRQGLQDRADTTTEFGGLLKTPQGGENAPLWLTPVLYPPNTLGDDRSYQASDKLFADTPLGIAHYHFHFQQPDNRPLAGPGPGDLSYAHTNRVNCVVFTSLSPNTFNADYYTPAGAVVDLGIYRGE